MKVKGFEKVLKALYVILLVVTLMPMQRSMSRVYALETVGNWNDEGNYTNVVDYTPTEWQGDGTEASPYLITNVQELAGISAANVYSWECYYGIHFKLMSDIDLSGHFWTPVGSYDRPFQGNFDGNGHTISNLTIETSNGGAGLFGVSEGYMKNLTMENVSITSDNDNVGALVGLNKGGAISDITLQGLITIEGYYAVGAVVGYSQDGGSLINVKVNANNQEINLIYGYSGVGGLVGQMFSETVENSIENASSNINVFADGGYCGGLVGEFVLGTIKNSHATGSVTLGDSGDESAGGLVGSFDGYEVTDSNGDDVWVQARIENSYATGNVSGINAVAVGGLVGRFRDAQVLNSYASGNVKGVSEVGGLLGYSEGRDIYDYSTGTDIVILVADKIQKSYATGSVNGVELVGGLVGRIYKTDIDNAYAIGDVTATANDSYVGGLVGSATGKGSIINTYSAGKVVGTNYAGGLVGYKEEGTADSNNFWDTDTSTQNTSAIGTGKTLKNMKLESTFTGWGFASVWTIETASADNAISYPFLMSIKQSPAPGHQPLIASDFAAGEGTESDPYQIETAKQLDNIRLLDSEGKPLYLDKHFILSNDIDLSTIPNWKPIIFTNLETYQYVGFSGKFNGNGKKITGLMIDTRNAYVGLFGLNTGEIKDLGIVDAKVTSTSYYVGIIVGTNAGKIINSYVSGQVTGGTDTGGLTGRNHGLIQYSYADVSVSALGDAGGLVGSNFTGGDILNSYALGSVYCNAARGGYIGGLVGNNTSKITNSYSVGSVTGDCSAKGGLVGLNQKDAIVTNSFWDILTSLQATSAAGIGYSTAKMKQKETFTGWGFASVWTIETASADNAISYPYLLSNVQDPAPGYESFKEVKKIIIDEENYGAAFEGMENIGLTKEELAQVLSVKLVLTPKTINELSAAEKALIEQYLSKNVSGTPNTLLLDVSLFKVVNGEESAITSTTDKITISFVVPATYRGKTFDLVRSHEGVVEKIDYTYDATTFTVTFKTDKFSTYGIVMGTGSSSPIPNTGVDGSAASVLLLMGLVLLGLSRPAIKQKTKNNR